jgi:thiol-disulfide isomerase/thioredoxin
MHHAIRSLAAAAVAIAAASAHASPGAAPEFAGIDNWINSAPLTMRQLRGKVVLVDFWTYDCINCQHVLPYVKGWHRKYKDQGLVVVGVHTPEYGFERNLDNLKAAVRRNAISFPVAQDNRYATWSAYDNRFWPAFYLVDKQGQVVYTHFGEGDYAQTEATIRKLLAQR